MEALAVGLGGFLGSLGRWQLGVWLKGVTPALPAGTLVANLLAALLIGLVTGVGLAAPMPERLRLFLAVGLRGGLSTFSTFSNETFQLASSGNWVGAALNVVANVASCLFAVGCGIALGRMLVS